MKEFNEENSKEFYAKLYYNRWAIASPNQTIGMIKAIIGFANCFKGTEKEIEELKGIIEDPNAHVLKKYPNFFTEKAKKRLMHKINLARLDWLYFRDTHLVTKLSRQYAINDQHFSFDRYICFQDVLDIVNLSHLSADEIFSKIRMDHSFGLNFDVEAYKGKIEQVGAVGNGFRQN